MLKKSDISDENFAALIYLSDRLIMQSLRRELERIASDKESSILSADSTPMNSLIEILVEATQAGKFLFLWLIC